MILFIDTTDYNKVTFGLTEGHPEFISGSKSRFRIKSGMTHVKSYKIDPHKSHETLSKLDEFLKKIPTSEIKKIIVNKGPGSFTGIRVGVSHAQALGFAWQIPVKALSKEQFDKVKLIKKRPL